ncbi:N-glycosylase/DNA lyase [Candidatus Woesearchaeota archaeon]|nr:N-glycosylase/DNA lyase [Candidatus Woesearchaeota archaeon]
MQSIKLSDNLAIRNLKKEYLLKKERIAKRLQEFDRFYSGNYSWHFEDNVMELRQNNKNPDYNLFEELCFCILTANTSAEMGMKSIDKIRNLLIEGKSEEMSKELEGTYRFNNLRPAFIAYTREKLQKSHNFELKNIIETLKNNPDMLRDFFVENVKGFGYKEASHFLRNIGLKGYAILDKHILNSMIEFNIIEEIKMPLNKDRYKELEAKLRQFSNEIGIPMDELDLLLWSRKNGRILK